MSEPRIWSDEPEVVRFLERARALAPAPELVVELGSYAMHDHDPRVLWPAATRWIGVDCRPGPLVDAVGIAHEVLAGMKDRPDLVLSVSALEHDPYWSTTLLAAVASLRPGGLLAATWAGPGWEPHEPDATPEPGWYRNVEVGEAVKAVSGPGLASVEAWYEMRTMQPPVPRAYLLVRASR